MLQFFHLSQNLLLTIVEKQTFIVTIILIRTILTDKPKTVIIGIQFCDKGYHFLAVTKGRFHKIKNILKCLGDIFCVSRLSASAVKAVFVCS